MSLTIGTIWTETDKTQGESCSTMMTKKTESEVMHLQAKKNAGSHLSLGKKQRLDLPTCPQKATTL